MDCATLLASIRANVPRAPTAGSPLVSCPSTVLKEWRDQSQGIRSTAHPLESPLGWARLQNSLVVCRCPISIETDVVQPSRQAATVEPQITGLRSLSSHP